MDAYQAIKSIPDKSIDCIYTDIPYLYKKSSRHISGNGFKDRISRKSEEIKDISNGIDYSILDEFLRVSKKVNIFIWCSKMQLVDIMNFFIVQNDFNWELLTWNKTNPQPCTNNTWLPDIEYCLYFREKCFRLNDGYEYKSKWFTSGINQKDKLLFEHPTIKPLELVKRHLLHTTQPNDIVFDPFSGSGTTAVACKELGRSFIAFELRKDYFNNSVDRLKGITKLDKKIESMGLKTLFDYED